jgi:hypothetical protein
MCIAKALSAVRGWRVISASGNPSKIDAKPQRSLPTSRLSDKTLTFFTFLANFRSAANPSPRSRKHEVIGGLMICALKVWRGESHCPFSLRLARREFLSSQAALIEFGAIEAASLRKDVQWTDEHS